MIVVKPVLLVPQAIAIDGIHGLGNGDVVFKKLGGHAVVGWVVDGQLHGDGEHAGAIIGHPGRAVGLFEVAAGGQGFGAVEDADIVETEKATREQVVVV